MSRFRTAIVPIVSIGVGVVLLSVAYAATNTDSAAQSSGPNPPALEKNERQMERATKVRAAKQKRAAKAHWAHLARVKAEKARQAELARQEAARQEAIEQEAIDQEMAERAEGARRSEAARVLGTPENDQLQQWLAQHPGWVPCGVTGAYCPPNPASPTCPEGMNYVPYAGKCVDGDW